MIKQLSIVSVGSFLMALGVCGVGQAADFALSVVASGLDNPRDLTFGPDGALYVTEAGKGGTGACVPSPSVEGESLCYGATSAVTKIVNGQQTRVLSGLPSIALADGSEAAGANDIQFDSTGNPYILIGLATDPNNRDSVLGIPDFGTLIQADFNNGSWTRVADLATYELLNNPENSDLISNPYAFVIEDNTVFAVDAGANDILRVGLDGSNLSLEYVFETERVANNPLTGLDVPLQSVPTSIVKGPDGAYYIGELTGLPYPEGAARIYRLIPGNEVEIFAEGFTQIVDLAFDADNNLYVLEYAAESLLMGNQRGAILKITPDGTRTTIVSDGLIFPTGLTISDDNTLYVSNKGSIAGQGEILRIAPVASVPEPTSGLSLLTFAAFGTALRLFYKRC